MKKQIEAEILSESEYKKRFPYGVDPLHASVYRELGMYHTLLPTFIQDAIKMGVHKRRLKEVLPDLIKEYPQYFKQDQSWNGDKQ